MNKLFLICCMYLLIDKQGNIVKKFVHMTANKLKDLLQQEINK